MRAEVLSFDFVECDPRHVISLHVSVDSLAY